ncbi:MAG: TolB family protein [Bacteroidia bacterium]
MLLISQSSLAQLPNTDIWLLDLPWGDHSMRIIEGIQNITNREGYDNQPVFSPDGKYILYTSVRDKKSDIYKYNLASRKTSQFTNTPNTAEYSPTFLPGKKGISVVMVEADDSTQRIWKFPMKGGSKAVPLLPGFDSIGYHCWFYGNSAAVFLLTEPNSLQLIDQHYVRPRFIADSVGRCMKYDNGMLYYTKQTADKRNEIYWFDLPGWYARSTGTVIESEDFIIYDQEVVYGKGSKLFTCDLYEGKTIRELADLSANGVKNISRIAIAADGYTIAVVGEKQ